MKLIPVSESQSDLYSAKLSRRRMLAGKSVEEKFKILLELQRITSTAAREAGRNYKPPWNVEVLTLAEPR
jgi:hypothetical protein